MSKSEWYYNVPQAVLDRGSTPGAASYQNNANYRAYTTVGQDDPVMAAAIMKSNIPAPLLDSLVAARTQQKAVDQFDHLNAQGGDPTSTMSEQAQAGLAQRDEEQAKRQAEQQQSGGLLSGVGNFLSGIPGDIVHAGAVGWHGLVTGLGAAMSPVEAPLAAGKASGTPMQPDNLPWYEKVGQFGEGITNNVLDWLHGVAVIGTGASMTDAQKQDMRVRGYDPDSPASRYAWYYNDYSGKGIKAVADVNEQRAIENGATPADAQAAREYVVSGAADDPSGTNTAGLSDAAKDFAARVTAKGQDSLEGRTLAIIMDQDSQHFGSTFADATGQTLPGVGRSVTTALADLIGLWYVNPLGAAGDAYKVSRAALYGVQADKLGEVARVMADTDPLTDLPRHYTGQVMNDTLEKIDNVFLHTQAGDAALAANDTATAAEHFSQASNITEEFRRTHPDLWNQWDALMQLRSGAVQHFVPRDAESMARESEQATSRGRNLMPLEPVIDNTRTPAWSLRTSLDQDLSDTGKLSELAFIRGRMASQLELLTIQEAMNAGRPLFRGKILLPGQIRVGTAVRQAISPIMDALTRQDSRLRDVIQQTADNPKLTVPVHQFSGGPEEFDAATGNWTTTLLPKDRGLAAAMGRMQNMMDLSPAGRNLSFYSGEGTETIRRLALQSGMPRAQAYALVNKWSMGTAGERFGIWRELATSMVEAGGLRDTEAKRAAVQFMTKGTISRLDDVTKSSAEDTAATYEKYASNERNTINVEGRTMAAGLLPNQMADGVTIPSMKDLKEITGRTALANRVLGFSKPLFTDWGLYKALRTGTQYWKSAVTSTFSNMERQIGEGAAYLGLTDPTALARMPLTRHVQSLDTAEARLLGNQAITGARKVADYATIEHVQELERLQRTDPNAYRAYLTNLGQQAGLTDASARALALVSENAEIAQLAGMRKSGLFLAGPLDLLRRARVGLNEAIGTRDIGRNEAAWHNQITTDSLNRIIQNSLDTLNTSAGHRALSSGIPTTGADTTISGALGGLRKMWSNVQGSEDEIRAAALKGVVLRRANLRPNAWTEIPTNTNTGLHRLADNIDFWMNDPIGRQAMQRVAFDHHVAPAQGVNPVAATGTTPEEFIAEMLKHDDRMKMFSARLNHDADGRAIAPDDEASLEAARMRTATDIVAEAKHMLGIHTSSVTGQPMVHSTVGDVLQKISDGQAVTANDLDRIPEHLRPPLARTPEYIPALETNDPSKIRQLIARGSAMQYDFFVGRPMQKLWIAPQFQAQMWRAYKMLNPVADALIEKGIEPAAAAHFLEHTATQYATNAVYRTSDNPGEHTVFSELADQHLMFIRATEDFFRRLGDVLNVNPGRVARSWLAVESAITSGAIYQQPGFGPGDPPEWMFTYPGTALANKLVSEGLQSMGWGDAQVRVPVFSGWNAPVKFLNPAIGNPIGHSVNPMFALPLRALRDYVLPSAWAPSVNPSITAVEGGEDGFATKSALRSLLPTWLSRVIDAGNWSDNNGKLASAFYSGFQTAYAAGIIPDENASANQLEDATHSIRQLMINNLVLRSLGGLFLPASPWNENMQTPDLPETNAVAMAHGVRSIRNEWFQVLEAMTKQYGVQQGLGRAHEEWARRYPEGRGIVNPEAYTVGTYTLANPDPDNTGEKIIARTNQMVNFFTSNPQLYEHYAPILPFLVPAVDDGYFNTNANQALFQMGLIERKGLDQFARDVRSVQNIADYFRRKDVHDAAVAAATSPADKTRIDNDWYDFSNRWEQAYPASARKRDANSNPDYVHATLAPTVGAFLKDEQLPPEMNAIKPAVQELYNDYQDYRTAYFQAKPWDRKPVNVAYWAKGDGKWDGTPMQGLWKAFRVYEGRN